MKKLSLYIFLGLMFCNVGFAELIELNKCFKIAFSEDANPKKFYNVNYRYEQSKFSINTATGLITRQEIFTDSYVKQYNKDSNIHNFHGLCYLNSS